MEIHVSEAQRAYDPLYLKRDRIVELASRALYIPALFICAPKGCGKTAAVNSMLTEYGVDPIRIDMQDTRDIPQQDLFWYLLVKHIRKRHPAVAERLSEFGFPAEDLKLLEVTEYISEIDAEQDVVVILDSYASIENAMIDRFLDVLIRKKLPWLHLIVISTKAPELDIKDLYFKGCCAQICMRDLLYTKEEIGIVLQMLLGECHSASVDLIFECSAGWFPAVFTVAEQIADKPEEDPKPMVFELLKSFFFSNYDQKVKQFLLKLSLLDSISPEMAASVLDIDDAVVLIERLVRENPFVAKTADGSFFLKPIYRDYLYEERIRLGFDGTEILLRAAEWMSESDDQFTAIRYRYAAKDYDSILRELDKLVFTNKNKIRIFDGKLINRVFREMDDEKRHQYPMATLKFILHNALYADDRLARKTLIAFKHYFDGHDHPKYSKNQIFAEIYMVCTALSYNRNSNARAFAFFSRKACELFKNHSDLISRKHVISFGFPHFTSSYYSEPGQYKETCRIMCEDFKYMAKASNGMGMGTEFLCRAEYLLETGSYDRVMEFATKAIFVASAYQQTCIVVCAKMTIARMLNCQGKIQDAADILREIETLRTTQTDPADIDVIDNCLGYLHVLLNKPGVPEWMTDVDMLMERRKNQGLAFSLTVYGMYLIRETEYLKFDALFEIIHAKQIALKNQMGLIYNYIHKAIASKHLYGAPEGVEALQKAVDIADQDEIAMPFIENIEELKTIFACESLVARADFICKIMNHKEQFVKNRSTRILSLREIEVLSLVEKGYSGEQIGETLFISPWTAKRHIQNIYSKLGVNSRIAAINKFREQI